ncbi:MAG: ComEA family DNA-binding protein [Pseudoflavonifractor sp.]
MKISKLEFVTVLLTVGVLAFAVGWFLRGDAVGEPIRVETARTLPAAETPRVLPTPAAEPAIEEKINLNTADLEALQALPGIGEKRAKDIIAYRTENGSFRIPEDITNVEGIGEGTLKRLIDYIFVE